MKPMKFFKSDQFWEESLFQKMSREFYFKAFSNLILIRISIAFQLID